MVTEKAACAALFISVTGLIRTNGRIRSLGENSGLIAARTGPNFQN